MYFLRQKIRTYSHIFFVCNFLLLNSPEFTFSETLTASYTPWSGYWWPLNQGGLITGSGYRYHPAPLEKYDLLTKGNYPNTLTSWYRTTYYDPDAPGWFGHCAAWSKASIYENYEIMPSSEDNIIFRTGDKKGLLTLSHLDDFIELADGTAENFHLWLLTYLKDQKIPFFADLDLTEEKWYYPIFQCDLNSIKTGSSEAVTAKISYVSDNVFPDFLGAKTAQKTYTYNLSLDSKGNIIGGEWTGGTATDHPEMLAFPLIQKSNAPFDYNKVREIAQSKDDQLENGAAEARLLPGTYNLVLLDTDNYSIESQAGESFSLTIEKKEGSLLPIETDFENSDSSLSLSATLSSDNVPLTRRIESSNMSPYALHLYQEDYNDPNIYSIIFDQKKHFIQQIPFLPKSSMWSGFALTNDTDEAIDNVMLTSHDIDGLPLHTLLGPLTLSPGEKKVFLSHSLPFRQHEYLKSVGLVLQADSEVKFVNLIGSGELLASQVQKKAVGSHIIIPETVTLFSSDNSMVGSIRNEAMEPNDITILCYRSNGSLVFETNTTLASHQVLQVNPSQVLFSRMPDKGWIEIFSTNDKELSGFVNLTSKESLDAIFGLIADEEPKFIPHIPESINWLTTVTLINPVNEDNRLQLHAVLAGSDTSEDLTITLAPFEKRTISIGSDFGRLPGDPLYHSIVKISGEFDFSGYYTYQKQIGGDLASYPLLNTSNFDTKLTMPHYPGKDHWWTGLVICNPLSSPQIVLVDAYDQNGELMVGETREIQLQPGAYTAFTVSSMFASSEKDISFVSCRTKSGAGGIGGLYLYGHNLDNTLSGAVF